MRSPADFRHRGAFPQTATQQRPNRKKPPLRLSRAVDQLPVRLGHDSHLQRIRNGKPLLEQAAKEFVLRIGNGGVQARRLDDQI
jgi:hypothetical protein